MSAGESIPDEPGSPSHTAQYVAVVRALLDDRGVIDDPYAAPMLTAVMRRTYAALRWPLARRLTDSPFVASLAARVTAFDDEVRRALDDGIRQVVILGAGYDSRAWRFPRPGVRYFEVDHPATQQRKRACAPADGPVYVACDLASGSILAALGEGGWKAGEPSLFVIEGVTMYLDRDSLRGLLCQLAGGAASGSRLAVNFAPPPGTGSAADRRRQRAVRLLGRAGGEEHRTFLDAESAGLFVESTGWNVEQTQRLRDRARALSLPRADNVNPEACFVTAIVVTHGTEPSSHASSRSR